MQEKETARILVVDDDANIINFFQAVLEEQGYTVATAGNGIEAIKKVKEFHPEVILLDVIMPEMDGYEVTEELKGDPATSSISIILVTGMDTLDDKVRGLEAGADDFITKPFNFDELVARVRSLVKLKRLQDQLANLQKEFTQDILLKQKQKLSQNIILVVEDDERISKVMSNVLGTGGYITHIVKDGLEAMEFLKDNVPDIILLDLMLPGLDGMEVLKRIREKPLTKEVPVIVITAVDDFKTKIKGLYIGADDYLVKPVKSLELLARVKANLRKYQANKLIRDVLKGGEAGK
ncbi:MAG: response regulator [Candidatus Edwardsbacteria bacterium]|nr:response regulator [Candidatus Edwardsbacteria bacterium]MBU2593790.1 response regulator [Candidatus Edwardsbacteria bacterium]